MALEVISWAIFHNISLVINLILEGLSIILHKDNKRTFKYNLKFSRHPKVKDERYNYSFIIIIITAPTRK